MACGWFGFYGGCVLGLWKIHVEREWDFKEGINDKQLVALKWLFVSCLRFEFALTHLICINLYSPLDASVLLYQDLVIFNSWLCPRFCFFCLHFFTKHLSLHSFSIPLSLLKLLFERRQKQSNKLLFQPTMPHNCCLLHKDELFCVYFYFLFLFCLLILSMPWN